MLEQRGVGAVARLRVEGLRGVRGGPFGFALGAGECLCVTGPSGAGKSVMLRMIADLDPHEGDAFLDGAACSAMAAAAWRRQVVYCPAESGWWQERVGAHFQGVPDEAGRLGLGPELFERPVAACSTGERQRLGLLRALLLRPPVLLLDEPTGPLDAEAAARVEAVLRERLQGGTTMVLVTHDERQAARMGTQRARMASGRLSLSGT